MSKFSKTVKLVIQEGDVTGIKTIELINWSIHGIICPRSRVADLKMVDHSQKPGVYILFSDDEAGKEVAYIGESEDACARIVQHLKDEDFEFKLAILFTSKDPNLTKAHVKFLENRLYNQAIKAKRVKVTNASTPTASSLPKSDQDAMMEFAENIYILMGTLGHLLFVESATISTETKQTKFEILHFDLPTFEIHARGRMDDEGFLVFKDSNASKEAVNSLQGGYKRLRDELIKNAVLKSSDGKLVFGDNYLFDSPSAAATIVAGGPRSGNSSWKNDIGKTLGETEVEKTAEN